MSEIFKNLKNQFFTDEETGEIDTEEVEEEDNNAEDGGEKKTKTIAPADADMILYEPRTFEEAVKIAKSLKAGKVCVVNRKRLDDGSAQRMLDFLYGVIFTLDGNIQQVDTNVYVYAPKKSKIAKETVDE